QLEGIGHAIFLLKKQNVGYGDCYYYTIFGVVAPDLFAHHDASDRFVAVSSIHKFKDTYYVRVTTTNMCLSYCLMVGMFTHTETSFTFLFHRGNTEHDIQL
ncbi:hypothetical protein ACJX0J_034060, partial [Zea mays]